MKFEEKCLSSKRIYDGKILNLRRDEVELPDSKTAFREVVEHGGGSCILCELDDKILLVKQFRYPYNQEIFEIPAGKLNLGEDPKTTAIRELEEEGGILAQSVELMYTVYPTPGYTNEIIRIYRAINPQKTKAHLDEDEFLDVYWFSREELKEMIKNGEIRDGKTLIALLSVL
jgi:ADP-ribose pyrophosphatase